MTERLLTALILAFAIGFVSLTLFATWQFHLRLSMVEEQIGWMSDDFTATVPDYIDRTGTTERYIDMEEVNFRLERLESKQ